MDEPTECSNGLPGSKRVAMRTIFPFGCYKQILSSSPSPPSPPSFCCSRVVDLCAYAKPGSFEIGTETTLLNIFIKMERLSSFA